MTLRVAGLLALLVLFSGCRGLGPKTISRDRFDYNRAISQSWKHQALLNLVKLRYGDVPIWLDVGQVVSGYTLETNASASGTLREGSGLLSNDISLGAGARYTDRPTITYVPLTGERFLEAFLQPIRPEKVFSLIQSGYAADFVLEMAVDSLQGLRNTPSRVGSAAAADPEFFRVIDLMREIQEAGAVGLRVEASSDDAPSTVFFFRAERVPDDVLAKMTEVRALLDLPAEATSFTLVSSPLPGPAGTLSVGTRSLFQLLSVISFGTQPPEVHVQRGLVPPRLSEDPEGRPPLLRIRSGTERPTDCYTAIEYEGAWFWIEHGDWVSKRTFSTLLFLFSLADGGIGEQLPTLTIPTQ